MHNEKSNLYHFSCGSCRGNYRLQMPPTPWPQRNLKIFSKSGALLISFYGYRNVRIIDSQERERTLVLPRQDKIEVGRQYRFYFKASAHKSPAQVQTGSSFIDESLPTDGFLGLEAASDYSNVDTVR